VQLRDHAHRAEALAEAGLDDYQMAVTPRSADSMVIQPAGMVGVGAQGAAGPRKGRSPPAVGRALLVLVNLLWPDLGRQAMPKGRLCAHGATRPGSGGTATTSTTTRKAEQCPADRAAANTDLLGRLVVAE
jgi:hypothetical protein